MQQNGILIASYMLTCMWKSVVLYNKLQVLTLMLKGYDEQLASGTSC